MILRHDKFGEKLGFAQEYCEQCKAQCNIVLKGSDVDCTTQLIRCNVKCKELCGDTCKCKSSLYSEIYPNTCVNTEGESKDLIGNIITDIETRLNLLTMACFIVAIIQPLLYVLGDLVLVRMLIIFGSIFPLLAFLYITISKYMFLHKNRRNIIAKGIASFCMVIQIQLASQKFEPITPEISPLKDNRQQAPRQDSRS